MGLIVLAVYGIGEEAVRQGRKPSNATLWKLYIGLGILSVIGLISYSIIIGGQFKCMLHSLRAPWSALVHVHVHRLPVSGTGL